MADLTQAELEEWIATKATGKFHYTKAMDGQVPPRLYPQLRSMMHRAKEHKVAFSVDGNDGWWRPADMSLDEICWWESNGIVGENLKLPLGLNKYCFIPLGSLILLSGKYNSGKTALCINVVNCNLDDQWKNNINFYVSEGIEQIGNKLRSLNSYIPKPPPFKMYRKTENFADVLDPDALSIIDYLRVDMNKPYEIANKLFEIFNKLKKGIALVAMQKPPGDRKLAFGGAGTAFEPALYLGMDFGWLGFEKIKIPKIVDIDPYALKIQFKLKDGVNFYEVHEVIDT